MKTTGRRWTLHVCAECGERAHGPGSRCPSDRRRTWTRMATVEVMPVSDHENALVNWSATAKAAMDAVLNLECDVREAFDAIDRHAAKDLDHELHSIVQHYRNALGVGEGGA